MSSPYDVDKTELLKTVLNHLGVKYNNGRVGWQKLTCPNRAGHAHGDRNPSASCNLTLGKFTCFACGVSGDGFDLMLTVVGVDAKDVLSTVGEVVVEVKVSEWW